MAAASMRVSRPFFSTSRPTLMITTGSSWCLGGLELRCGEREPLQRDPVVDPERSNRRRHRRCCPQEVQVEVGLTVTTARASAQLAAQVVGIHLLVEDVLGMVP
jgi:hypothetical protein